MMKPPKTTGRRRRRRKRFGSSEANNQLRAATVHLEEADWQAQHGNCGEGLKRLVQGSEALGRGRALDRARPADDGLAQMRDDAAIRVWHCFRKKSNR